MDVAMRHESDVVLVRVSHETVTLIERTFPSQPVRLCRSDAEFLAALNTFRGRLLVWEVTAAVPASPEVARKVGEAGLSARVVVLASLEMSQAARIVVALVASGIDVSVIPVGCEDRLSTLVELLGSEAASTADHHIIRRIVPLTSADVVTPLIAAIGTGGRKTSVPTLADWCGVSVRKLEADLAGSGAPRPHKLLAWSTALHSIWRVEYGRRSLKQAASDAGFSSVSAFGNHLYRNVGMRPSIIVDSGGFWSLLDTFEGTFLP